MITVLYLWSTVRITQAKWEFSSYQVCETTRRCAGPAKAESAFAGSVITQARRRQRLLFPIHYLVMPGAYARLPNPRTNQDADQEMRAAFDEDSDDEQDERRPLNVAGRHSTDSEHSEPDSPTTTRSPAARPAPLPGTYDFERTDYDYPPPGSPPPATRAFANDWGNSNGLIPSPPANASHGPRSRAGRFGQAVAKLLPATVAQRFGLAGSGRPSGTVGGGSQNDGVFANVTAKPARQVRVQNGQFTVAKV